MTGEAERAFRDPLSSPALGTAPNDLIVSCEAAYPQASVPPPAPVEPGFALAFSGGGFRATLTALGCLRFLADAGLLARVRYSSSVSGGSVANGLFAHHYDEVAAASYSADAFDNIVLHPFLNRITAHSLVRKLVANIWRLALGKSRADLLADAFEEWFFPHRQLEAIPTQVRFVFNAANLTTGVRFGFEREVVGDWVLGHVATPGSGIRLADAVAASAAFPGAFGAISLGGPQFPCAAGRRAKLLDGGAYDNLGLEAVDDLPDCLVVVNAGGTFRTGKFGRLPVVGELKRVNSLLYRQSNVLRLRTMVERFQAYERALEAGEPPPAWGRLGILFNLATTIKATGEWLNGRPEHPELRIPLALVKTSFAKFPRERALQLVRRGWWLTGANLSKWHRPLLPGELPGWRSL